MTLIGTGDDGKAAATGGTLIQGKDGSGNAQHVLVDTNGRLDLGTVTVTGASGGTSSIDDAAFTAGSGTGTPIMGFVSADTVDSGDVGVVGMDVNRNLKVSIEADNVGIGGGIQYTEDAAAAANPVGNALIGVRADTLAGVTTADGDNVAARMTDKGELYVKHADSVAVTSSTLATAANQTTIIGHVDGIEGLLTTIDGDTGNIATSTATIAGAVSGTEMQVDVLTMPTTTVQATNLDIRDLAAASDSVAVHGDVGVFDQFDLTNSNPAVVAIVDSNGDQITSFGGGTQYTEDAAAAANPVGTALNLIRADSLAGITTADGDNLAARGTDKGELYVKHVDSIPVTGTFYQATQPVSGTVTAELSAVDNAVLDNIDADLTTIIGHVDGLETLIGTTNTTLGTIDTDTGNIATAVQVIDNAIHVDDAAFTLGTSSGVMMMGFAGTQSVNANDAGAIAMETDGAIHIHDGGNTITVDGTVAVTGVSTLAEQQTQTTHLATIAGDTTSIQTAVELIDDAVATLGTTTYTEAASKGLTIGAVRRDADTTLVDTTNEIGPLQMNAAGQLKVEVFSGETLPVSLTSTTVTGTVAVTQSGTWDEVGINDSGNSITVDNGGTFAVQVDGSALTALQLIDDAVYVDDADWTDDTSKHLLVGGVYQSTQHTVTDGDVSPLAVDSNGNLRVNVMAGSAAGTEYSEDAATPATPQGPTIMIERDDALSTPVVEGDWMGLKGDANGALYVTLATKLDSTNDSIEAVLSATDNAVLDAIAASVAAIDTDTSTIITNTGATTTALQIMDDWDNAASDGASVSGDVAHDTADAGEPVKVGFKAESSPKGLTLVADGDRTDGFADVDGIQMVKLNTSNADIISERVSNTNGSATAFSNFGAVASTKNYITSITVYNSSSTAGYVDFTDGSGGTVKWTMPLPATSGSVISSAMPLFSTTANTALYYDVSAALTTVYISVSGYQSKA